MKAKLNHYEKDNTATKFEEFVAIITDDFDEEEFNEDCTCDGLELKESIELPQHNYINLPTNRLLKPLE